MDRILNLLISVVFLLRFGAILYHNLVSDSSKDHFFDYSASPDTQGSQGSGSNVMYGRTHETNATITQFES